MKILSAIGGFFARIGRWIKETAWIQPLLIVGAIFAIIFAIPHIIDVVKSWFDESDAANKYFAKYQLSLKNGDVVPEGQYTGTSKVDELFTYLEDKETDKIKSSYGEKFFVAIVEENSSSCKDLYGGLKMFQDKFNKNDEFKNLDGKFKLYTIYKDSISTVDDETNLFDTVWGNHYDLFEDFATTGYLTSTYYAQYKGYNNDQYQNSFVGNSESCPISAPLLMYFDFTDANLIKPENQRITGLSDVIFTVDGTGDLDKARTLKNCWAHADIFNKPKVVAD